MQFARSLGLLICLTVFGVRSGAAQTPPVPEYYGVFLWDGSNLRELQSQRFTQVLLTGEVVALALSKVATTNQRPTFVVFDRRLRTSSPPGAFVEQLRHLVQLVTYWQTPGTNSTCEVRNSWSLLANRRPSDSERARIAPAGDNPEMVRIVLTGDLAPGWYALSFGESEHYVFGVNLSSFDDSSAGFELWFALGQNPELVPLGTYLSRFPGVARTSDWKCPPPVGFAPADRQASAGAEDTGPGAQRPTPISDTLLRKYPDARSFHVLHNHGVFLGGQWPSCEGILYVFQNRVKYEVVSSNDGSRHDFDRPFSDVKEAKANRMPVHTYPGFHIRLNSGQNYNFAFPGLDPAQVLAAFPAILR